MNHNHQFGTDAMIFCLAWMSAPGTDIVLSDDRLTSARNFTNKIWNAARFLFMNLDKFEQSGGTTFEELAGPDVRKKAPYKFNATIPLIDEWIFERLAPAPETLHTPLPSYPSPQPPPTIYHAF